MGIASDHDTFCTFRLYITGATCMIKFIICFCKPRLHLMLILIQSEMITVHFHHQFPNVYKVSKKAYVGRFGESQCQHFHSKEA